MTNPSYPTTAEVERISAQADPVVRNLQITQCYHELSLALAERSGPQANWCTFATWASRQAGQTIRKEDVSRALEAVLGEEAGKQAVGRFLHAARRLGVRLGIERLLDLGWQALDPEGSFSLASEAVGRGNRKVFAEIGFEFARFYTLCLDDNRFDEAKIAQFCEGLRPGDPPDGQEHLRRAFRAYYQALFEDDSKKRSELLLYANLSIGFHEQTRLQPEINEALVAPVVTPQAFVRNLVRAYIPQGGWKAEAALTIVRTLGRLVGFEAAAADLLKAAQRQAHLLVTETMMSLELAGGRRLRLGEDLAGQFPPELRQITNPELKALLAQVDPTPDSTRQSGADFWGDLDDRLHFIADLFRVSQMEGSLLDAPFSGEQVVALKQGQVPTGRL